MRSKRCGLLLHVQRGLSVCLSVWLLVTSGSPAKTAELIEMPFGFNSWAEEPCIGSPDPPKGNGHFGGYNRACPGLNAVNILSGIRKGAVGGDASACCRYRSCL